MTHRLPNGRVVIAQERPQQCDECGKIRELRPYGKDCASVCFECAQTPKHKPHLEANFQRVLDGK